ncbi:hypothetical protein DFJ74DRAFT_379270 [Hyaloraphidium curvatum]|nr:hypothetical protein DFJ74DRAFT_379270 [Hyaloraphidium curvatum]
MSAPYWQEGPPKPAYPTYRQQGTSSYAGPQQMSQLDPGYYSVPGSAVPSPTPLLPPQPLPSAQQAWKQTYDDSVRMEMAAMPVYEEPEPKCCGPCCKPKCCCCCIYATWAKWMCLFIWLAVLAGVGVALYFCWPRGIPPTVTVSGVEVGGAATLQAVYPYKVEVPVIIRINVTSQMKIGIPLDSIETEGFYTPSGTGRRVKVAGGRLPDIYFAPESTTSLAIPFNVNYTANNLTDPVISSLLQDCNIATSGGSGKIRINWTATIVLKLFTFARFPISGSQDVDCPANSIGESLVKTAEEVLGSLGVDPSEIPDDPAQLQDYLISKASDLGLTIPPGTNILSLATQVAEALGYDLTSILNGADLGQIANGNLTSITSKFGSAPKKPPARLRY